MWSRFIRILLAIAAAALCAAAPASALPFGDSVVIPGVWYTSRDRGMSATAVDTPWGWTNRYPFATIGQAYTAAAGGDTIVILSGDTIYTEVVSIGGKANFYLGATDLGRSDSPTMRGACRIVFTLATTGVVIDGLYWSQARYRYAINIYGPTGNQVINCVFDSQTTDAKTAVGACIRNDGSGIVTLINDVFNDLREDGDSIPIAGYGTLGINGTSAVYGALIDRCTFRDCEYAVSLIRANVNDSTTITNSIINTDTLAYCYNDFTNRYGDSQKLNLWYCDTWEMVSGYDTATDGGAGVVICFLPEINAESIIDVDPAWLIPDGMSGSAWAQYSNPLVGSSGSDSTPLGVAWGYVAAAIVEIVERIAQFDLLNWLKIIGVGF